MNENCGIDHWLECRMVNLYLRTFLAHLLLRTVNLSLRTFC